jgi:D-sedoheptulose 7-phosphate isomerase
MENFLKDYHNNFLKLANSVIVTSRQKRKLGLGQGVHLVCNIIKKQSKIGGKVFFIGNGGSAAIANHMAIDFWKNGRIPAVAFSDSSLLTCISNDFGYEKVFEKPIEFFAAKIDVLIAISSSGKSKNILNGVKVAQIKGSNIISLSGFDEDNPLRRRGVYNFYVPSHKYGYVEVIHQYICHWILDTIMFIKGTAP